MNNTHKISAVPQNDFSGGVTDTAHQEPTALEQKIKERLKRLEVQQREDPMTNPVRLVALDLLRDADEDNDILADKLTGLLQEITARSFSNRAAALAAYIGEIDTDANIETLRHFFETLATDAKSADTSEAGDAFERFRHRMETPRFGIVLTAHPTFGLRADLRRALCEIAAGETAGGAPLDDEAIEARLSMARTLPHGPDKTITLDYEHDQATEALTAIQQAMAVVNGLALEVAEAHFGDQARTLTPKILTVASWVGYDLDGRSDIGWLQILQKRASVRARQMVRYRDRLVEIARSTRRSDAGQTELAQAQRAFEAEAALAKQESALFLAADNTDAASVRDMAKGLAEGDRRRETDPNIFITLLDAAIKASENPAIAHELGILRAEMAMLGLGSAHVHVRLNASQIHNAVARAIGMEGAPEDPGTRRRYLARLTRELDTVTPVSINFGSTLLERTTARSLFMTVRMMQTYMDSTTPVRFLIAESDTSFTVLAALYFAKLFQIEKTVDISPLFETPVALEKGSDIIAELLENPHYVAYIKGRGRLCIQTGFSDAGRYLGQLAASLAVERLHIKLAKLLQARGITDVEVLIFDTHGESMGRGAHPGGLRERFRYLSTPQAQMLYKKAGIPLKQEVSFQGGDGYRMFATPKLALGTVAAAVMNALEEAPDTVEDPFYSDPDHTLDFFMTIIKFNENLLAGRDYPALVGTFGANMVPKMGSRTVKRQHEAARGIDRENINQIRAISHNAILQQMGWLANTVGGIGAAIHRNLGWFTDMHASSPRMRQMVVMAQNATNVGSVDALMAYARLFDPSFWLSRGQVAPPSSQRDRLRSLSRILDDHRRFERMSRVIRLLIQDHVDFQEGIAALPQDERPKGRDLDKTLDLKMLHAIRLAAIQQLFLQSTNIPRFAPKLDFTREDVIHQILDLDVVAALGELREIFPAKPVIEDMDAFGVGATYTADVVENYAREHERIFDPMERMYDIVVRTTAAIAYHTGAHG